MIKYIHHIAIIGSDKEKSIQFYTEILEFTVVSEVFREDSQSYKIDLSLNGKHSIELFIYPKPPKRLSYPEACGLRHIAFEVDNLENCIRKLKEKGIEVEPMRVDIYTKKRFAFFKDPNDLPIEFYEK